MAKLKKYEVVENGLTTIILLDDQDAKRLGLHGKDMNSAAAEAAAKKEAARLRAAEKKAAADAAKEAEAAKLAAEATPAPVEEKQVPAPENKSRTAENK